MTPQEETMLGDLIRRVQQTQLTEKDPEAQELLDQQIGGHPDSLYILAQTVLVQKYALEQAQKQLDQFKQQAAPQPVKAASFLGGLFGHSAAPAPPQAAPQQQYYTPPPSPPFTQVNQQAYSSAYPPPAYGAPQGYPPMQGGGSSFLRSAATTAAGVAAGALAFEGVESLMHGFGHTAGFGGGGFGGEGFGGGFGGRPEETIVNNYYDEPRGGERGEHGDERGGFDASDRGNDYGDRDVSSRDNDFQPQSDQADDVNVGSDDGASFDDASLDSSSDDFGGNDSDDSNFV